MHKEECHLGILMYHVLVVYPLGRMCCIVPYKVHSTAVSWPDLFHALSPPITLFQLPL